MREVSPMTGRAMSLSIAIVSPVIRASAPTRIDLAGGTLDIWPVCFSLDRPATTVNLALSLRAQASVEETGDGHVDVRSEDRDEAVRLPVGALRHDRLGLATRLAEWYGPGSGLRIVTRSTVPPQSGLGGSSALGVALAGALARLRGRDVDLREVQDVETALLGVPTGYQDFVPPLLGGVHALTAAPGGPRIERIEGAGRFLAGHLLLADTRIAHESGMNNWEVVKRFLDGDGHVRACMNRINDCARDLRGALEARDLDGFAAALDAEWRARRELAPVVSNARIEAMAKAARDAGALAAKVCGAGGGGCMVLVVREAKEPGVARAIETAGGAIVPFEPDAQGLRVSSSQ